LGEIRLIVPEPVAVGVEGKGAAEIVVGPHLAVAIIAVERAFRRVHRDMVEIDAEPVALRVAVGKEPRLQHLVRREADAGDDVGGREGRLLDFGKIVLRVAVELHHADLDQRILGLRPDFGKIERVVAVRLRLRPRHTWMKSVQRGKSPPSIAVSRSRPLLSRSLATTAAPSASVRFWIPCCVRKWNLTQTRSLAALIIEKVWLPKRCMWRKLFGMPRSDMTIVTWCNASGSRVQKSQLLSALRSPVRGSRLIAWLRSGKRSGSRKKNTGVLLPTMSQLPSSV